ncbi:MAG: aminoacetone oxidase family FAD-binding enzyme [Clostridia bacterium]|nr:aminoacetone oxidase family FAD-binding enzyme [Clostridia bacterium]
MGKIYKVAIIGGGAAGLAAAAMLSEAFGSYAAVFERLDRVGKKITATGNGRGNFTNENLSVSNYHSEKSDASAFVKGALGAFGNGETVKFLNSLGVITAAEKGRIYPASFQASSALDLLRARIEHNGAEIFTGFEVKDIKFGKTVTMISASGARAEAENVILAAGGKCRKQFGTDGSGYFLASLFGHTVTPLYPSLVQIKTETDGIKQLNGIKQEAVVTFIERGTPKMREKGDVLFTEFGVSGNAAFQVSRFAADCKGGELSIEFLPEVSAAELENALIKKIYSAPYLLAEDILTGVVNKQLGRVIVARSGVSLKEKCPLSRVNRIVKELKDFRLKVEGTLGFNYAQVTRGGVSLSEIDPLTMRSALEPRVYFAGEIMDIDGDCGGYNLQWAFSSAFVASRDIAGRYGKEIEIG